MRLVLLAIAGAVVLAGCGAGGDASRVVPASEIKARPDTGYDGAHGGK